MNREQREELTEQWLDTALERYGAAEPSAGLESRILAHIAAQRQERVPLPVFRVPLRVPSWCPRFAPRGSAITWVAAAAAVLIMAAATGSAWLHRTGIPNSGSLPQEVTGRGLISGSGKPSNTQLASDAQAATRHIGHNAPQSAPGTQSAYTSSGGAQSAYTSSGGAQSAYTSAGGAAFQLAQGGSPGTRVSQARQPRRGGTTSNTQPAIREWPRRDQFPSPMPLTEEERLLLTYLRMTPKEELLLIAQRQAAWRNGQEQMRNLDNPPAANGLGMAEPDEIH